MPLRWVIRSMISQTASRFGIGPTLAVACMVAISACASGDGGGTGPLPIATVEVVTTATTFEVGQSVQFTAVTRDRNGSPVNPGTAFSPFNVTIRAGGTVKFEFPAEEHDVIFSNVAGAPADITVRTNATVSRVFATVGTFPYECKVHPGMTGQVTVVP